MSDPPPPAVQVIALDPTKNIGTYPWQVGYRTIDFRGGWHAVGVRVRGGSVTVRYDGADLFIATTAAFAKGLFGFTAGSGGETDAVALRNLHAAFYDCTP